MRIHPLILMIFAKNSINFGIFNRITKIKDLFYTKFNFIYEFISHLNQIWPYTFL